MAPKKKKAKKSAAADPKKSEPEEAAENEDEKEDVKEHPESAYSASAVIFFTRTASGEVDKVLMALEERKVQASYIGLTQQGKILQRMLLFPMGRREKKDKGDTVETAKREYVEETGDYGGLSRYLDFADFCGDSSASNATAEAEGDSRFWSGKQNLAVYFKAAGMINLFCEVPAAAATKDHRAAAGGISLKELAKAEKAAKEKAEAEAAAAAAAAAEAANAPESEPSKKRKKEAPKPKAQPNYSVGKTDHLEPAWVPAAELRRAMATGERSPVIVIREQDCRLFPTAASVLRLPEVRQWLGAEAAAQEERAVDAAS